MTDHALISRLTAALARALDAAGDAPDLDQERALLASLQAPRRVVVGPGHVRSGRTGLVVATIDTDHGTVCAVHLDDSDITTYVPVGMLRDETDGAPPTAPRETTDTTHARVRAQSEETTGL